MPDRQSRTGEPAGGRPRDRSLDAAILSATLELLDETGYQRLTFEAVARRAGTSRPAIYRRWSGRPELVLAAIADRLNLPSPPDTGCTLCDFGESLNVFLGAYRTIRPEVLGSLYSECAVDDGLRSTFLETVLEPARRAVGQTLDRAVARGDLREDVDREQVVDLLGALVHYRAVFGREHLTDAEAARAIETLLRGAAVDYAALLAHSRLQEHESAGSGHVHLDVP